MTMFYAPKIQHFSILKHVFAISVQVWSSSIRIHLAFDENRSILNEMNTGCEDEKSSEGVACERLKFREDASDPSRSTRSTPSNAHKVMQVRALIVRLGEKRSSGP